MNWVDIEADIFWYTIQGKTGKLIEWLEAQGLKTYQLKNDELSHKVRATKPFVMIVPTILRDDIQECVPVPVQNFLACDERDNVNNLRAIGSSGNRNYGRFFAMAGRVLSQEHKRAWYRYEGIGDDVEREELLAFFIKALHGETIEVDSEGLVVI